MKRNTPRALIVLVSCLPLAFLTALTPGCNKESSVQGPAGKQLTLEKPASVTLKQGDMTEVKITIQRGNLQEPVTVSFDKLPAGVTVVDADKKIVGKEASYVLKAEDSAAIVSDHHAKVTAEGPDGIAVSQTLVITIGEKSSL